MPASMPAGWPGRQMPKGEMPTRTQGFWDLTVVYIFLTKAST